MRARIGSRIGYCITHSSKALIREVSGTLLPEYHFDEDTVYSNANIHCVCFGPFAECSPPEMSEEDWQALFSTELSNATP
jgi:hypothetical protein